MPPGSDVGEKYNIALKDVEREKHLPADIVRIIQGKGWSRFTMDSQTKVWKRLNAKDPAKAFGALPWASFGAGKTIGPDACGRMA